MSLQVVKPIQIRADLNVGPSKLALEFYKGEKVEATVDVFRGKVPATLVEDGKVKWKAWVDGAPEVLLIDKEITLDADDVAASSFTLELTPDETSFGAGDYVSEIRIEDPLGDLVAVASRAWLTLNDSAISGTYAGPFAGTSVYVGSFDIANGASSGTVSGIAPGFTPSSVVATVNGPTSSSFLLFARIDLSSITATGFSFDLNGTTESAGYKLAFMLVP